MNSYGAFAFEEEQYYSCYSSALLARDGKNSMHHHSSIAKKFSDLKWSECIDESLYHATKWLDAESIPTGHYDIHFTPDALASLMGCFQGIFSAKTAMDKTNPFREKLGEVVGHKGLTIMDSPHYAQAFTKHHFDGEGLKKKDIVLIQEGVLRDFYHNTATANYFKTKTNAAASRGARSSLNVSGSNIVIQVGTSKLNEMQQGEYVEVHAMQGLHSGANQSSGNFSFAITGYLYKNGDLVKPIKGVTLAGNFYKMLQEIKMMGDILHSNNSQSFFAPLIKFSSLTIAG